MSDPVARILQESSHDPVADILHSSSATIDPVQEILSQQSGDIPQGITSQGGPQDQQIDKLLARSDISPQQRARLTKMKQDFARQSAAESGGTTAGVVKSFVQGAAEPIAAVAATGSDIIGAHGAAENLRGAVEALEPAPTQSTIEQLAQTGAYVAGNFLAQAKIFKAAGAIADALGLGAKALAPGVSQRALTAIGQAAAKVGEATGSATLGEAVQATPKNLVAGLLGQVAQDPASLTTPQGAATAIGFSLFGALTEGQHKAKQAAALVKELKTPEAAEVLKQHVQQEALDAPQQMPPELAQAHQEMRTAQDQALATIDEHVQGLEEKPADIPGGTSEELQARYLEVFNQWKAKSPWLTEPEVAKLAAFEVGLKEPPVITIGNEAAKQYTEGSTIPGTPIVADPQAARVVKETPANNIVQRYTNPGEATDSPKAGPDVVLSTKPDATASTPVQTVLSTIADPTDGPSLRQRARNVPGFLYKHIVKSTAALGKVTRSLNEDPPKLLNNPEALADLTKGSTSSVDYLFHHGGLSFDPSTGEFTPNNSVPALADVINPLKTKALYDEFRAYLIANRKINDERFAGRDKTVNPHMAELVVNNASSQVRQQAQAWYEFNRGARQLAEDGGLVTPGTGEMWDELTNAYTYLPRMFEKADVPVNLKKDQTFTASKDLFLTLKGGSKKFVDPVFASIDKTERIVKAVYRNRAIRSLADLQAANPEKAAALGITQIADADAKNTPEFHAAMNNFIDNMKAQGVEVTKAEAVQATLLLSGKSVGGPNYVAYWDGGQLKRLNVPPDIVEAYNSLNPRDMNLFVQWLGLPARGLRSGITLNPLFQAYNFIRDSYDGTLNSKYGFKFGLSSFEGFISAVRKDKNYLDWLANGGGFGSVTSSGSRSADVAFKLLQPKSKAARFISHPIEVWKEVIAPVESAARLGEFIAAKRAGATSLEAAYASRKVTVDFSQIGLSTQAWAYMTAFMNPAIQGLDTTAKAVGADPLKVGVRGFMAITLPSMYLWYANRNDEEIQQLRKSNSGLSSWFMRLPNGDIAKIPKPFFYGQIFGTAMEAALDKMNAADPRAMERFGKGLADQVTFSMIPNALAIPGQVWANKDIYSGAPIVPADAQDLTPEYQYGLQTSELSKKIGATLGFSPAKIDFLARQLLGHSGQDLMLASQSVLAKDQPTPVKADWPVLGKLFARYPSMGVEPVQTFYDEATKTGAVVKTVQALAKDRPQEVQPFLEAHREDFLVGSVYAETRKQISEIRNAIELVQRAPADKITPQEKRQQIDYLLRQIITITGHVNDAVDSIREKGIPSS